MTIRLNKVARDLNVGIQTAVDFLQKKGFTIEANPMTKISDEQHALLIKEFSKDQHLKKESDRISLERHNKEKSKESVSIEGYESDEKENKPDEIVEIRTVISDEIRPRIKQVGKIDLNALNPKHGKTAKPHDSSSEKSTPATASPVAKEPISAKAETPSDNQAEEKQPSSPAESKTDNINATPTGTNTVPEETDIPEKSSQETEPENKEEEVFTLNHPKLANTINVVGKIDLEALNQQTRPKKKSKEYLLN